jgi:hypothetical protein
MNNTCKIKDDDEILEEENNRYNFRRFTPEEIQKKYSPFERVSKKKEISFLFQKKKYSPKLEGKVSLEDIMTKMETLDLSGNTYISNTPPYSPFSRPPTPIPTFNLDEISENSELGIKEKDAMNIDG